MGATLAFDLTLLPAAVPGYPGHLARMPTDTRRCCSASSAAFDVPLAGIVFCNRGVSRRIEQRTSSVLMTDIIFAGVVHWNFRATTRILETINVDSPFTDLLAVVVVLIGSISGAAVGAFALGVAIIVAIGVASAEARGVAFSVSSLAIGADIGNPVLCSFRDATAVLIALGMVVIWRPLRKARST